MNDDQKHRIQPDDSENVLPLPKDDSGRSVEPAQDPAVELVRKRVDAAYATEPDAVEEATDLKELQQEKPDTKRSRHQQFIYELTGSGKSLAEIQTAWHEYYAGLTDKQKHEVWQEFYDTHAKASHYAPAAAATADQPLAPTPSAPLSRRLNRDNLRDYVKSNVSAAKQLKPHQHLQSLFFGLGVGVLVLFIFLFGLFNERFIAPFIQPSRTITNTPIILSDSSAVGPNPEVVIPKINVEIPVIYGVNTIDDNAVETALESGVVHYADTADPGQNGNVVVVGHSSNNIFNPGKYKFAFVLLSKLENGDTFYLQKDGKRYTYQVYRKEIVSPTDVSVLGPTDKPATATLITCDPPGTSTNRLVVIGQQISPDPSSNLASSSSNQLATQAAIIPGNSPSLWSRLIGWL